MTSSTLAFSEIEPFINKKNKTRRTREPLQNRKKVEAMINKIHKIEPLQSIYDDNNLDNNDDDDDESLADFNPPPLAESSGVTRMKERREKVDKQDEERINLISYSEIPQQYSNIPTPYIEEKQPEKRPSKEDVIDVKLLMEKLNYVISMLEEQQDEKINNITEEVVLYCFLGVFIIYLIDSFAKVGKYVR